LFGNIDYRLDIIISQTFFCLINSLRNYLGSLLVFLG
jgi:hypothetical protein